MTIEGTAANRCPDGRIWPSMVDVGSSQTAAGLQPTVPTMTPTKSICRLFSITSTASDIEDGSAANIILAARPKTAFSGSVH